MEKINLDENLVIEMYQDSENTVTYLAKFFNVSVSPIKRILKNNNIKIRTKFSTVLDDIARICKNCEIEQPINSFSFCGSGNIYRMFTCKTCNLNIRKEKALKTKIELSILEKKCSKCKILQSVENFYADLVVSDGYSCSCKTCDKKDNDNKREYRKQKYENLKLDEESYKAYKSKRKDYDNDPEVKEKTRLRLNKYIKDRCSTDLNFKLGRRLRAGLRKAIKSDNGNKFENTIKLLGCSIKELKNYLESQFAEGMTWENWGKGSDKWNIDHIKPICSFDLTDIEQQKECFNYKNLRPLWELENFNKMLTSDRFLSIKNK